MDRRTNLEVTRQAINFNGSSCCLVECPHSLGPPNATSSAAECCGYYRMAGGPLPDNRTVMARAIDVVSQSRNKALLFTVPLGKGHLIATGLNVLDISPSNATSHDHPEKAWVLDRLLRFGSSLIS